MRHLFWIALLVILTGCYVGVLDPTPTPVPTPTCVPGSYATIQERTPLTIVEPSTGAVHFRQVWLEAGTEVLFLYDSRPPDATRLVTTTEGERLEGRVNAGALPVECQ